MVAKRVIPCLDIKAGRTVKGVQFQNLRDVGDPVELARRYSAEGADELVFLDISATDEDRSATLQMVSAVARELSIPFTVGGGISSADDVSRLLRAGADKISLNSAAVRSPEIVTAIAKEFGSQCVVVAIDSKFVDGRNRVHIQAGKRATDKETLAWAREVVDRGAGELLLTSMDHDGTRAGFAVSLTEAVVRAVQVPVIASGGAGCAEHFVAIFNDGGADAALAASVFHEHKLSISQIKSTLREYGVEVRI